MLFFKIFLTWTIFKVFIEFVTVLFLLFFFYDLFFGWEACGILAPQPGTEPTPLALEVQSLNDWTVKEPLDFVKFLTLKE